jgi:hypothetical protein
VNTSGFARTMAHPFDIGDRFSCGQELNPTTHQRRLPRSSKRHLKSQMRPTAEWFSIEDLSGLHPFF